MITGLVRVERKRNRIKRYATKWDVNMTKLKILIIKNPKLQNMETQRAFAEAVHSR